MQIQWGCSVQEKVYNQRLACAAAVVKDANWDNCYKYGVGELVTRAITMVEDAYCDNCHK